MIDFFTIGQEGESWERMKDRLTFLLVNGNSYVSVEVHI